MNYYLQLCSNAQTNFDRFQNKQLELDKEQIFADSFKINFYSTMLDFFLDEKNYLQSVDCELLCLPRDEILDELYDYYVDDPDAEISTYGGKIKLLSNYVIDNLLDDEDIKKLHDGDRQKAIERKLQQNVSRNYANFVNAEMQKSPKELIDGAERILFYSAFYEQKYTYDEYDKNTLNFLYSKGDKVLDYLFEAYSCLLTDCIVSGERLFRIIEQARNQHELDCNTKNGGEIEL